MKTLVFNCGSSSLKYKLFELEELLAWGIVERIGMDGSNLSYTNKSGKKIELKDNFDNHNTAVEKVVEILLDKEVGVVDKKEDINAIGHRVVHGGERFKDSAIITDEVLNVIKDCSTFAPLHNPHNITGILAAQHLLPKAINVAVFDTAFHSNMPEKAFIYGLPYEYYENDGIRRYGFHGTSHYFVTHKTAEYLGKDVSNLKLVTCHLGNGSSIAAVKNGVSIDTSMGFTPLEGLIMGTRSGDLDTAIAFYIQDKYKMTCDELNSILQKKSGLIGISGISSDMREIESKASENKRAQLAIDTLAYRIRKYIGSYIAVLGGVDAIVFTGGIGENSDFIREKALEGLEGIGIVLDKVKNAKRYNYNETLSTPESKIPILVIPTNEELVIAQDTMRLVK